MRVLLTIWVAKLAGLAIRALGRPGTHTPGLIARRLHPGIPTLLVTGFADMTRVEQVLGGQQVLSKPFDLDTLGNAVTRALEVD